MPALEARQAIAWGFWNTPAECVEGNLDPFFEYYARQCDLMVLRDGGRRTSVKTHADIIQLARSLRALVQREKISCQFPNNSPTDVPDEERDSHSIDLAARLLLMIKVGDLWPKVHLARPIKWDRGTIKEHIERCFPAKTELSHDKVNLDKILNARNLSKIAGIEVVWTDNLTDHLRVMDDDTVAVFHHASFLLRQQSDESLFPHDFLHETLQTLKLLFPRWDRPTQAWFRNEMSRSSGALDPALVQVGYLSADERKFENFKYWHDRLVMVAQAFDEARPNSIRRWWVDRRNGVQWSTFWIAVAVLILTVVFGLIQCIEGGIQAYKVLNPGN
ncbi:hypothetical protein B0T24DRAFT_522930 [Lasiosphaeria ovina]|uniref:Uncharacterized protein n=1 Tax=Lasiosphaeria ovina TaxID=92902 RepID=A0AAE0KLG3_9PEZI|nr:hypothetical protein B0T24DRAFT_522930 [Lasiosphaeria ovina]